MKNELPSAAQNGFATTPVKLKDVMDIVADMEVIEKLLKNKGRFVGEMVHISIPDLANAIRADLVERQPLDVQELKDTVRKACPKGFAITQEEVIDHLHAQGYLSDPSEIARLREENKRLREALEFYADESEWYGDENQIWALSFNNGNYDGDGYIKAKQALAAAKAGE